MAKGPEARLVKKILDALRARGAWCSKLHGSPYQRGLPDILGCYEGSLFAFEVKAPGRRHTVTALQQATLSEIEDAGGIAVVVTSVREAMAALDEAFE